MRCDAVVKEARENLANRGHQTFPPNYKRSKLHQLHVPAMLAFVCLALLLVNARAFGGGAPSGVCVSGRPGGGSTSTTHGSLGTGDGGYSLSFSPALGGASTSSFLGQYTPNTEYTLTLKKTGDVAFGGFAITPLGAGSGSAITATSNGAKNLGFKCDGGEFGVTQTGQPALVTSVVSKWTAPASGTARIRYTVMDGAKALGNTFYIKTISVEASGGSASGPSPASTSNKGGKTPSSTKTSTATATFGHCMTVVGLAVVAVLSLTLL